MTKEHAIEILKKLDYLLDDVYSTGLVEDEERNKYQYAIETILSMLEEKDKIIEYIIKRLDNDEKRITEILKDGNHSDYYSKCRLKAYRTKTKELRDYINNKYFIENN